MMNREERIAAIEQIKKDTNRVIEAYRHSQTPAEAVETLVTAYGYEEAVKKVALLVNRVSLADGRIYDGVREWAQSTGAPTNEECHALDLYGVDSWIHSAHVNDLGMQMKRYEPKQEEEQTETEEQEAEEKAEALALIERAKQELEGLRLRSAWDRGVNIYALELLEDLAEAVGGGWVELWQLQSRDQKMKAMLNGADDWNRYSWGGCSLIFNADIAERLCTPTELRRTKGGQNRPNSSEGWLDVQTRALTQAAGRVSKALKTAQESR